MKLRVEWASNWPHLLSGVVDVGEAGQVREKEAEKNLWLGNLGYLPYFYVFFFYKMINKEEIK